MFCPNCSKEIPNGSAFCTECGATINLVQPITTGLTDQKKDAAAIKGKSKKPLIFIISGAAAAVMIAVVLILVLSSGGPGDKIVKAFEKTFSEDSLMFELTDDDRRTYTGYAKGKDKDFKLVIRDGSETLLYESKELTTSSYRYDDDYGEYRTHSRYYDEDSELYRFISGIAARDTEKMMDAFLVSEGEPICENPKDALSILKKLLNDTEADYIKSYSAGDDSFAYSIDMIKLYEAAKEKGLKINEDFDDKIEKEFDSDLERDRRYIYKFTVSIDNGYISRLSLKESFYTNGEIRDEGNVNIKIKKINEVKDKVFDADYSDYDY